MCGRFAGFQKLEELREHFAIDRVTCDVKSNYNIAPSQPILALVNHAGENHLVELYWGFVPFWAKDISIGNRMINARAESVAEKPTFRNAFKKRRCLIPASGFYEWKGEKGNKQPMFITLPEARLFAFAGLWETWNKKDDANSIYRSCTIITTEASDSVRDIHHRMPVILKPDAYRPWLDPENQDVAKLHNILKTGIFTELVSYPVSKHVNATENNDPSCIEPLKSSNSQTALS